MQHSMLFFWGDNFLKKIFSPKHTEMTVISQISMRRCVKMQNLNMSEEEMAYYST